ncbi:MAG: hypothetical protein Q9218_004112 [Villophora microphyllina]
MCDCIRYDVARRLADGFGALLEQVQELEQRNAHLERLLDRMREQAQASGTTTSTEHKPKATLAAVQRSNTGSSSESTFHVDHKGTHLRLGKVPAELKFPILDGLDAWHEIPQDSVRRNPHSTRCPADDMKGTLKTGESYGSQITDNVPLQCPYPAQQVPRSYETDPGAATVNGDIPASQPYTEQKEIAEDPIAAEAHSTDQSPRPPSQAGSASKCPIRFLDQHSAEELAEYFKNHSHELPRSHEICVKRYQRNEDQIRLLDHKYGSLVSMIQGLGQKHQPMLHTKIEDGDVPPEHTSQSKIDTWAKGLDNRQKSQVDGVAEAAEVDEREGRFDRPLKEIRVGESPSRPWGISVPQGARIPPSAASNEEKLGVDISNEPQPSTPATVAGQEAIGVTQKLSGSTPSMVFTGPVFMGYSTDQITEILQRTGLGKGQV